MKILHWQYFRVNPPLTFPIHQASPQFPRTTKEDNHQQPARCSRRGTVFAFATEKILNQEGNSKVLRILHLEKSAPTQHLPTMNYITQPTRNAKRLQRNRNNKKQQ